MVNIMEAAGNNRSKLLSSFDDEHFFLDGAETIDPSIGAGSQTTSSNDPITWMGKEISYPTTPAAMASDEKINLLQTNLLQSLEDLLSDSSDESNLNKNLSHQDENFLQEMAVNPNLREWFLEDIFDANPALEETQQITYESFEDDVLWERADREYLSTTTTSSSSSHSPVDVPQISNVRSSNKTKRNFYSLANFQKKLAAHLVERYESIKLVAEVLKISEAQAEQLLQAPQPPEVSVKLDEYLQMIAEGNTLEEVSAKFVYQVYSQIHGKKGRLQRLAKQLELDLNDLLPYFSKAINLPKPASLEKALRDYIQQNIPFCDQAAMIDKNIGDAALEETYTLSETDIALLLETGSIRAFFSKYIKNLMEKHQLNIANMALLFGFSNSDICDAINLVKKVPKPLLRQNFLPNPITLPPIPLSAIVAQGTTLSIPPETSIIGSQKKPIQLEDDDTSLSAKPSPLFAFLKTLITHIAKYHSLKDAARLLNTTVQELQNILDRPEAETEKRDLMPYFPLLQEYRSLDEIISKRIQRTHISGTKLKQTARALNITRDNCYNLLFKTFPTYASLKAAAWKYMQEKYPAEAKKFLDCPQGGAESNAQLPYRLHREDIQALRAAGTLSQFLKNYLINTRNTYQLSIAEMEQIFAIPNRTAALYVLPEDVQNSPASLARNAIAGLNTQPEDMQSSLENLARNALAGLNTVLSSNNRKRGLPSGDSLIDQAKKNKVQDDSDAK